MDIALISHDARKQDLVDWVDFNFDVLRDHKLFCTGTTGRLLSELFLEKFSDADHPDWAVESRIICLHSGSLGGDQEIGAMVANGKIDMIIFLADHLSMQPHDSDIKALSRLAGLYNIPMACNRATADYLISSPLFDSDYQPIKPDFSNYINRKI